MDLSPIYALIPAIADNLWAQFLVTIFFYGLLAAMADIIVKRVLKRLSAKADNDLYDAIIDFIHAPLYLTILILGFLHGFSLFTNNELWPHFVRLGKSLILLIWFFTLVKILSFLARHPISTLRGKVGQDMVNLGQKLGVVFFSMLTAYWLLGIWQIDLTPLLASAGIAGIAIALAAKDTLANFFGGISLFADGAFKVGDYIIIDNNERGEVIELGIRSTKVLTRDDVLVNIPNSILANSKIINESAPNPLYRIKIPVSVAYGSDLGQVEDILQGIGQNHHGIVSSPAPRVRLRLLADSGLNYELLVWVKDPRERGMQTHLLLREIYEQLNKAGISIPFPQQEIHLHRLPTASS
ncbi:MAG: mechanosensitive ion channel domain-containing protein [Thermodesulfobacteriota bacterium]